MITRLYLTKQQKYEITQNYALRLLKEINGNLMQLQQFRRYRGAEDLAQTPSTYNPHNSVTPWANPTKC